MLLSVKLFSFFLKNFNANCLMFINTIRIEFSPTACTAKYQLWRIIFNNLNLFLFISDFNWDVLKVIRILIVSLVHIWLHFLYRLSWGLLIFWTIFLLLSIKGHFLGNIIITLNSVFYLSFIQVFDGRLVIIIILVFKFVGKILVSISYREVFLFIVILKFRPSSISIIFTIGIILAIVIRQRNMIFRIRLIILVIFNNVGC